MRARLPGILLPGAREHAAAGTRVPRCGSRSIRKARRCASPPRAWRRCARPGRAAAAPRGCACRQGSGPFARPESAQRHQQGRVPPRGQQPFEMPCIRSVPRGISEAETDHFVHIPGAPAGSCRARGATAPRALVDPGCRDVPSGWRRQPMHQERIPDRCKCGPRKARTTDRTLELHLKKVAHEAVRIAHQRTRRPGDSAAWPIRSDTRRGWTANTARQCRPPLRQPAPSPHRTALWSGDASSPAFFSFRRRRARHMDRRQVFVTAYDSHETTCQPRPELQVVPEADRAGPIGSPIPHESQHGDRILGGCGVCVPHPPGVRSREIAVQFRLQLE